jgi:hypothetical protein
MKEGEGRKEGRKVEKGRKKGRQKGREEGRDVLFQHLNAVETIKILCHVWLG